MTEDTRGRKFLSVSEGSSSVDEPFMLTKETKKVNRDRHTLSH